MTQDDGGGGELSSIPAAAALFVVGA